MSRKSNVKLRIDSEKLRNFLDGKITLVEAAAICGVTKQAVNNWLSEHEIRPRMLAEIVRAADLSAIQVEEVLAPQLKKRKVKLTIFVEGE